MEYHVEMKHGEVLVVQAHLFDAWLRRTGERASYNAAARAGQLQRYLLAHKADLRGPCIVRDWTMEEAD